MVFVVRQLVEKSWEHQAKMFFIFIDLRKEYDSVPQAALWQTLGKLGVPDSTVDLIKSFHQETRAKLRLDGALLDKINISNGLRLFSPYACLFAERWTSGIDGIGVQLKYKHDRKVDCCFKIGSLVFVPNTFADHSVLQMVVFDILLEGFRNCCLLW